MAAVTARLGQSFVVGVVTALILPGCGGDGLPRATASGKVTFAGQPVTGGIVVFTPERGPQATSPLSADGTYHLTTPGHGDGAVVGRHHVSITPLYDETLLADYDGFSGEPPPPPDVLLQPPLPEKYLSPQTSPLSAQVLPGGSRIDFEIEQ